jgi:predicted DNA-binding protein
MTGEDPRDQVEQAVSFTLPDELRAQAQALAERQGQTLDELVREAIELVVARGSTR